MSNNGKAPKGNTDSDSLLAMQALLRIRSDSLVDGEGTKPSPRNEMRRTPAKNKVAVVSSAPLAPVRPRQALQRSVHALPGSRQVSFSPHLAAKARFYPQSPAFLPLEPAALSHSVPAMPVSPAILSMGYPAQSQNQAFFKPGNDSREDNKPNIRTGEIQAALHSKPQRGRKRDNLSADERQELTRTRNREHAKSTRIRKKARYQELLDNEKQYKNFLEREELDVQRHNSVLQLLSTMSSMLFRRNECLNPRDSGNRAGDKTVTFSEGPALARNVTPLCDVLASTKAFVFHVEGHQFLAPQGEGQIGGVEAMDRFCQKVLSKAIESHGTRAIGRISCEIKDPCDRVALNQANLGFTTVQIVLRDECRKLRIILVDAILQCRFAPSLDKVESARWCTLNEKFEAMEDGADCHSASSVESLGLQTSYPSMVSLDPLVGAEAHGDKSPTSSGGDESGLEMTI